MRTILWLLRGAAGIYALIGALMYVAQRSLMYFPEALRTPPAAAGFARAEEIVLDTDDGERLIAWHVRPADGKPVILYFHGNGEVACEHDWIAQLFSREGISLFVADYRGYGLSGGVPSFASVTADAHPICGFFLEKVRPSGGDVSLFVMGRSLGSHCAVELAFHYPERFRGLIVESGSSNIARLLELFGLTSERQSTLGDTITGRLRSITLPALIIHGERDSLIPVEEAIKLHGDIGSQEKRLEIVPGADHNSIMAVGMEQYLVAVKEFVLGHFGATDKDGPA
jgi:hypothetical protein